MRGKIFLYLFLFILLILIFQYVNSTKILEAKDEKIQNLEEELVIATSRADSLMTATPEAESVSFLENGKAISYFESRGYEAQEILRAVEDALIEQNFTEGGNPLVPYEGMEGDMHINSIEILNHKWLTASFTDGKNWGEVLLSYEVDNAGKVKFYTEKAFFYPEN